MCCAHRTDAMRRIRCSELWATQLAARVIPGERMVRVSGNKTPETSALPLNAVVRGALLTDCLRDHGQLLTRSKPHAGPAKVPDQVNPSVAGAAADERRVTTKEMGPSGPNRWQSLYHAPRALSAGPSGVPRVRRDWLLEWCKRCTTMYQTHRLRG